MKGYKGHKKIAVIFSGGPAPSANAVISSVSLNFLNERIPVIGFFNGFEHLERFNPADHFSLIEGLHFIQLDNNISGIRNRRGIFLKTSRANPGREIHTREDLDDPQKSQRLHNILNAFNFLGIGYLVTIGGDDTLKTANFLAILGLPVLHIPKTIDNDYYGIPWTFGYWSAVQTAKEVLLNLKADAESTSSYFIAELMGRKAGWITYAAGVAGEAVMMVSSEDIEGDQVDIEALAEKIVDKILLRERYHKYYGVIAVAEGLADRLPDKYRPTEMDKHGNIIFGTAFVGRVIGDRASQLYEEKTGRKKKITYKQIGYETRNVPPISFDVVLGSMLGFGVVKLYKQGKINCLVSVSDNFDVIGVPFSDLIDPATMRTKLRTVPKGSDFYELKEALTFQDND